MAFVWQFQWSPFIITIYAVADCFARLVYCKSKFCDVIKAKTTATVSTATSDGNSDDASEGLSWDEWKVTGRLRRRRKDSGGLMEGYASEKVACWGHVLTLSSSSCGLGSIDDSYCVVAVIWCAVICDYDNPLRSGCALVSRSLLASHPVVCYL